MGTLRVTTVKNRHLAGVQLCEMIAQMRTQAMLSSAREPPLCQTKCSDNHCVDVAKRFLRKLPSLG